MFPRQFRKSLRGAFADYERAARGGCTTGWMRIGRDYEMLNDMGRARMAYEQGIAVGSDVGCQGRVGTACLMGQLGMVPDHRRALTLLRHAANQVTIDTPEPAYIYGMVLVQEFNSLVVSPEVLEASAKQGGSGRTVEAEAAHFIQKAA